jgi:hypothetical protein
MRRLAQSLLVVLIASAAGVLFLEIAGALTYRFVRGATFSRTELQGRLLADRFDSATDVAPAAAPRAVGVPDQPVVLHPFFGFVINPAGRGVNEFGFFRDSPLTRRSPDKRSILFTGGSVADQVFQLGQEALRDALRDRPDFDGRRIEVLTTAVGGYKQPQQMMILAYLLSHGADFDVVINLDGFNEIDSSLDNVMTGISPYYPHTWKLHARLGLDTRGSAALGRIEILREERARLRGLFARPLLRSSAFSLALWDFLDRAREGEIRRRTVDLEAMLDEENPPPQVAGPPYEHVSDEQVFADMARFWARSSLHMARLCEEYGIAYVHALQPNQYLPGSKALTDEEREVAYDETFPGFERVPVAYPMLIERGRALRRNQGVNFVDLTPIFADEGRTVYNDFCCHVNQLGAESMARSIAESIPELPE